MNSRRLPTDSAMRTHNAATQSSAVTEFTTADGCVHTDDTTKLSPTSCEFVFTPPRRDATRQFRLVGVGGVYWALESTLMLGVRVGVRRKVYG